MKVGWKHQLLFDYRSLTTLTLPDMSEHLGCLGPPLEKKRGGGGGTTGRTVSQAAIISSKYTAAKYTVL